MKVSSSNLSDKRRGGVAQACSGDGGAGVASHRAADGGGL
jgi:hypothetical protein